jgi:hypothetical protein
MAYDVSALQGYFKYTEGTLENALPEFATLQRDIPFQAGKRSGRKYIFPVNLRRPHGVTWAGTGTARGSLYTLEEPVSGAMQEAEVEGTEFVIQDDISYGALSSAQEAGEMAFGEAMDTVTENLVSSMRFYLEMSMLYGGGSIGTIAGRTVDGGAVQSFQLTQASWAPGLWANMENAYVDVYDDDFNPLRTTSDTQVTEIDSDNCVIELTGTEGQLDTIVANDVIVPRGAYTNWFYGLDAMITNTSTMHSIDAAAFHLWRGNTSSASSAKLTLSRVLAGVTKGVVRGGAEELDVALGIYSWDDLLNDTQALKRFAESTKSEVEMGSKKITFYGSNGANINLNPHSMVKAGEALIYPRKRVKRIGSSDATLKIPGVKGQQHAFYQELETKNGIRLRGYWDQALVITHPARCTKITSIVPQSMPYTTQAYV